MNDPTWLDENSAYLAASLEWLRLRLHGSIPAEQEAPKPAPPPEPAAVESSRWSFGRKASPPQPATTPLPNRTTPALSAGASRANIEMQDALEARQLAARIDPPPSLVQLATQFGLSDYERDVLLLCAALEFDGGFGALIGQAPQSGGREYPTFGLAMAILDEPHWDALSAHRPLRNSELLEINQPGSTPLTLSGLRVDERILAFIKGINEIDDRITAIVAEVPGATEADLSESQRAVCDQILAELHTAITEGKVPVVQLSGPDASTKLALASRACGDIGSRLLKISAEALPVKSAETDNFSKLWQRETCLLPVALYIQAEDVDSVTGEVYTALSRLLSKSIGLVFVGVRENWLKVGAPTICFEVDKPTHAEQYQAWLEVFKLHGVEDDGSPEQLAGQFDLSLIEIREAASRAGVNLGSETSPSRILWDHCRALTKPRMDQLASRIDTKATWDDLVLPDEQMRLMRSISEQVRERYKVYNEWGFASRMNRGFGISALFAGESGTGKTMAAEVIANDLRLNLYRIDLSSVVSKYIGETEKNLRKMFDAAEQGGAILFFDEADALFGKRSEVKDSHDRYANIEINYLLQRMESFSGLAILATNAKSALDNAFLRRLRFIVNFPVPAPADRRLIWQKVLPSETPQSEIDFDRLARFNVTGANIQSIALNAAFLAAGAGTPITMPTLLTAAYTEMRKLDRPLTEADLK